MEKDVFRKPNLNISGVFLRISLPSFSRNVPTLENVLHRTLFHQYKYIKPKGVFSVFFSHNSKPLQAFALWQFSLFSNLYRNYIHSLSTKLHLPLIHLLYTMEFWIQIVFLKRGVKVLKDSIVNLNPWLVLQ